MDPFDLCHRLGISRQDFDALELSVEVRVLRPSCQCRLPQELARLPKYLASGRVSRKVSGQPDPVREVDSGALRRLLLASKKVRAAILLDEEIYRNCSVETGALVCCCFSLPSVPENAARNLEGYVRDLGVLDEAVLSRGIRLSTRDLVPLLGVACARVPVLIVC